MMLENVMKNMVETRTGMGFDVHALIQNTPELTKPMILCGIEIDHDHHLKGHSDADVAMHALTDAILGAISEGDIGRHFPPSDPKWKDMDSSIFLERAVSLLENKNGKINNLDLTIICEAPKITPHSDDMRTKIANICNIEKERVSIKATTTEKLGFTGRGEGIAAQAVATIKLPITRGKL